MAGGRVGCPRGFQPRPTDPKSAVLPLDEGAAGSLVRAGWCGVARSARGQRNGAEDGTRTRDPHLGKVMLYQLSHFRSGGCAHRVLSESQMVPRAKFEPAPAAIFSRVLYQLSYLGPVGRRTRNGPDGEPEDRRARTARATECWGVGTERPVGSPVRSLRARRARTSDSARGCSPVSSRSRLIRSTIGGWVENIELARCSNLISGP